MNTILPYFRLDSDSLWKLMPGAEKWMAADIGSDGAVRSLRKKLDESVGFYDWPTVIPKSYLESVETIAKDLRARYEGAVIFGIGGSFLGPATVVDALQGESGDAFPLYWLSNSDAPEIRRIEKCLQKKKMAAIVISKSGGTVETLSSFFHLSHYFDKDGIVVITDPEKGELRRLSVEQKWKALDIPPNIGGRFSVLTAVGLLPTALAGLSASGLIDGATRIRAALEQSSPAENPAYQLARAQFLWDQNLHRNVHVMMPYEKRLKYFADWWVQLFGESLGKKTLKEKKAVGFTPLAALGTTDQHSMLQLFKEGPSDKVVGFLSVHRKEGTLAVKKPTFPTKGFDYLFGRTFDEISHFACLATQQSLKNSQLPSYRIEIPRLDEPTLGALFFFFETSCAFAGELYGVDAFNQPGVEEAKQLLKQSLS